MNAETKILVLSVILSVASRFFCAVAITTDTKLNHVKFDRLISAVVTVAGVSGLALYFIVRRWLPQEVKFVCTKCGKRAPKAKDKCKKCSNTRFAAYQVDNRSEMLRKVITCALIAAVMAGVRYWVAEYSPIAQEVQSQYSDFDSGDLEDSNYAENGDSHI